MVYHFCVLIFSRPHWVQGTATTGPLYDSVLPTVTSSTHVSFAILFTMRRLLIYLNFSPRRSQHNTVAEKDDTQTQYEEANQEEGACMCFLYPRKVLTLTRRSRRRWWSTTIWTETT
jgi:hypothetical protein